MEIEEVYMEIARATDEMFNLRSELECDQTSWNCSECKNFVVCNSLSIVCRALTTAKCYIENS